MPETPEKLLARKKTADGKRQLWRSLLEDCFEFGMPDRNTFSTATPGQRKGRRVYDSTGIRATTAFANRLQHDLTPPFQRWIKLIPGIGVPEQAKHQVKVLLDQVNEILFAAISQSNFDTAINEFFLDLACGTASMLVLDGDDEKPVMFAPVPISELSLDEGPRGDVWGIFRDFKTPARALTSVWPDAKLPQPLAQQIEDQPDSEIDTCEVTHFDPESGTWHYVVLWRDEQLLEREFEASPWLVTRWLKVAGETFGRGPLVIALPDVKTLNKVRELVLKNASLAIAAPLLVVDDGVVNPNAIVIAPGATIPVARAAGNERSIAPLERVGDFNVAGIEADKLAMSIKQMLLDESLPPESGPVRSATEIVERVKELSRAVGAPFGRLMSEMIVPLVNRVLTILARRGEIPPLRVDGRTIAVQVQSPLAQLQDMSDVDAFVRWIGIMRETLGDEIVMLSAVAEDAGVWLAEKLGVAAKLVRSDADRQVLQQLIGQLAAARAQAQQQQGGPAGAGAETLQ